MKVRTALFALLLFIVPLSNAQVAKPRATVEDVKVLIKALYPELDGPDLHATYSVEDDSFSDPRVPREVHVVVEKYCWLKADPKTGALPIHPHRPCSMVDSTYRPEFSLTLSIFSERDSIRVGYFWAGGSIFKGRSETGVYTEPFKYGPDKRAEVIKRLPLSLLAKLLDSPLKVTDADFDSTNNFWGVLLQGPHRSYSVLIEPVNGYVTQIYER